MRAAGSKLAIALCLTACVYALSLLPQVLQLEPTAVAQGQLWRLITAHFTHSHFNHYLINTIAAWILYFGFFSFVSGVELIKYSAVYSLLISLGLLAFYPEIIWYNGLSGLLHALLLHFSVQAAVNRRPLYWSAVVIVWLKVLLESISTYTGYVAYLGEMQVISEAHLIGVIAATVIAMCFYLLATTNKSNGDFSTND